jgi:hypothetical protein
MSDAKRLPSHRLYLQHDSEKDDSPQTEVGALWPHSKGGGFNVTLRRGLSIAQLEGTRLVAFTIDHEREARQREQRMHERDDRRQESRRDDRGRR